MMDDELITTKEAADFLGVSAAFLQRDRTDETEIPYVKVGSRAIRYKLSDLNSYIDDRRYQGSEDEDPGYDDEGPELEDWD